MILWYGSLQISTNSTITLYTWVQKLPKDNREDLHSLNQRKNTSKCGFSGAMDLKDNQLLILYKRVLT